MTDIQTKAQQLLSQFVQKNSSQAEASRLLGVSTAIVSNILNGKFDKISDDMLQHILDQITVGDGEWQYVTTTATKDIAAILADAKEFQMMYWLIGEAGCGKSTTAELFKQGNKHVYTVLCSDDMSKQDFIMELAKAVGVNSSAGTAMADIMDRVVNRLKTIDQPLIIFDEADKLRESAIYYLITIYNKLRYKTGVVMMSTSYGQRRLENGLKYNKKGYAEIWSRIGRKCVQTRGNNRTDVAQICLANGVTDDDKIQRISDEVSECDFDLRRCERLIHRFKKTGK